MDIGAGVSATGASASETKQAAGTDDKPANPAAIPGKPENTSGNGSSISVTAETATASTTIENTSVPEEKRMRGRPKGSKNKKTLQREAEQTASGIEKIKRGRGRPKGAKNKKTMEREAKLAAESNNQIKRGRGRPKDSKNKTHSGSNSANPRANTQVDLQVIENQEPEKLK